MKTLLTSTALAAMLATGAAANSLTTDVGTVDWAGNTDTGGIDQVQCVFVDSTDGEMSFNEGGVADATDDVWTTTTAATMKVLVRNGLGAADGSNSSLDYDYALDYLMVEPANHAGSAANGGFVGTLDGSVEIPADVDYTGGAGVVAGQPGSATPTVTTPAGNAGSENIKVVPGNANQSGIYTLSIAGTATMDYTNTNDRLDANTDYKVRHLVTCMQTGTAVN